MYNVNVTYNAEKTKITVVGSKADMEYYREVSPWYINGHKVTVAKRYS